MENKDFFILDKVKGTPEYLTSLRLAIFDELHARGDEAEASFNSKIEPEKYTSYEELIEFIRNKDLDEPKLMAAAEQNYLMAEGRVWNESDELVEMQKKFESGEITEKEFEDYYNSKKDSKKGVN